MFSSRIEGTLEAKQCEDQAGFRKSYCTLDHVFTLTLIQEKTEEWKHDFWLAAVDFMKAFDSVEHDSIWLALREQGVGEEYIALLQALYTDQTGVVTTAVRSKVFDIKRGTKQGDPLSTLLFNAVLEHVFGKLKVGWDRRGCGLEMSIGAKRFLSNLRFADDVLLFARTQQQLITMLAELQEAAASCGLKLHPDKTKILSNASMVKGGTTPNCGKLGDDDIEILAADEATKYLGRKVCFKNFHEVELEARITAAWSCFHKHKQELTSRFYPLRDRLRLFDSTVTPTVLYGCEAWVLKDQMKRRLRAVQRKMLRMVLGSRRRLERICDTSESVADTSVLSNDDTDSDASHYELEPWRDFLQRATHVAEERAQAAGMKEWLTVWRTRQWRWARKVVSGGRKKWSNVAIKWCPQLHTSQSNMRAQARPKKRWADDFHSYLPELGITQSWESLAEVQEIWADLELGFSTWGLISSRSQLP